MCRFSKMVMVIIMKRYGQTKKVIPHQTCFLFWPVIYFPEITLSLRWRHNGRDSVSNHQPHDCLLNRLFSHRSKKTSKPHVTGHCVGNSPGTGEFPAQMATNAKNVSIWWRHHVKISLGRTCNHIISALALLLVIKTKTELETLLFSALMPLMCV